MKSFRLLVAALLLAVVPFLAPQLVAPAHAQEYVRDWIPAKWDSAGSETVCISGITDTVRTSAVSCKNWAWNLQGLGSVPVEVARFIVIGAPGTSAIAAGADSIYVAAEVSFDGGATWIGHYGDLRITHATATRSISGALVAAGTQSGTAAYKAYSVSIDTEGDTPTNSASNIAGATNIRMKVASSGSSIQLAKAYFNPLVRPAFATH